MYQALYRKYRPRIFKDVVGQEHITETLLRQLVNDRLSHAYLFVGTRGTGKTTCAKILSRAVNCISPVDGEPCNKCNSCIGIEDGSILDVLELDAASNNSVDNVRALRDEAIYSPASVNKRVYIVDEVHMLSISAFNALLKILEEPPEHILFILATTELHKVPATIQGRCQRFSFKRLLPSVLENHLNSIASLEGLSLTSEAAQRLAALADGSMRDAISLLDQCAFDEVIDIARIQDTLGLAGHQEILRLIEYIADQNVVAALCTLDELYKDGRDMVSLLNEMTSLIRDTLVFKLSPDSSLLLSAEYSRNELSALSVKFNPNFLFSCLDVLKTAISGTNRSGSTKLTVEMCIIKMCDNNVEEIVVKQDKTQNTAPSPTVAICDTTPSPTVASGDFWNDVLGQLKDEPSLWVLLSDGSKVQHLLNDNHLTINVTDSFSANLIESEFIELLKGAAAETLGRDVIVKVEVTEIVDSDNNNEDKLDRLSAFGIDIN